MNRAFVWLFDSTGLDVLKTGKRSFLAPVQYGLVEGKMTLRNSLRARLLAIDEDDFTAMGEDEKRNTVYKGFEAELEWRLVVQHEMLRSTVSFRANRNVLVPYIKLGTSPLPLDLTERSIAVFLEAKGYDVPVRKSRVPFRT